MGLENRWRWELLGLVMSCTAFHLTVPPRPTTMLRSDSQVASIDAEYIEKQEALYDLLYVERLPPPEESSGGLILVATEDPPMHLAKVLSVGSGQEGETGHLTPNRSVKKGDYVYLKWPWGIGPKDEQSGDEGNVRRFSFIRYQDVCAVVSSPEDE